MRQTKRWAAAILLILLFAAPGLAGDYGWMPDFNLKAQADPSGFRARLESRFRIGDLQIRTVLSQTGSAADAYMVCRLGEMSRQPVDQVLHRYKTTRGKGWGAVAKSLGIKPGSKAFHTLKNGQDLYPGADGGSHRGKGGKGAGKGKGKGNQ